MALLIALALFVAQAINFAMILQGRQELRMQTVVGPAVTRYVDAVERLNRGGALGLDGRGRLEILPSSPVQATAPHEPGIEGAVANGLREAGMAGVRVETEVHPIDDNDPALRRMNEFRALRYRRLGAEIVVAMVLPAGRGWLVTRAPWPRSEWGVFLPLIGQTLILYVLVLLPVLWGTRQISRPLRRLAAAARRFQPGQQSSALEEDGPRDVRAVIAAFNALQLRVTAMLDEKDRMLGAIGHDLRTPLAALRVRVESVEDDVDRARMIDTITEMNRTLDDILSLARLGRPSEPIVDVDLAALIDAVVEDFRDLGQPVEFEPVARLTMRLRPSLMRRAIRNLIENAVKYGTSAAVRLERWPGSAVIVIADIGPGIPTAQMEQVFDPFTRLESSRNRETGGIGLGLALARAIVRDAGGDITLGNRHEGGLEARITLPMAV
jgi:signal transduction histidine kinase